MIDEGRVPPTSWMLEVCTGSIWTGNSVRLPTHSQAVACGRDLMMRWSEVTDMRVVPMNDPVNHHWQDGRLILQVSGG